MSDLTDTVLRGGLARVGAHAMSFVVRIGSIVVFARLLSPKDFGLVGMVTAITGVLSMLRDFGLSSATVQRSHVTEEQLSGLFWFNLLFGAILALGVTALAPFVSRFYDEPRLFWVAVALAPAVLCNAAGVQHAAILQRQMRFTTLSAIDVGSFAAGTGVGIAMAVAGFSYWSLVAATLFQPIVSTACLWILLQAEFLGLVLVLVYVGAVMVLFLFVVMMLDINSEPLREGFARYLPVGRVVTPADVAALAVHIMTNTAITGATYDIDGGQQFV